jgi:hypothetical protein
MPCDWAFAIRRILGTDQYIQIFWNTAESSPSLVYDEPMEKEAFIEKLQRLTRTQVEFLLANA